jgi:hypothetical protein
MEKITKEELIKLTHIPSYVPKPILYIEELKSLDFGEGIKINNDEWKDSVSPKAYYQVQNDSTTFKTLDFRVKVYKLETYHVLQKVPIGEYGQKRITDLTN